tara:strand:- start:364 stop:465 length:102 start_codon:yes stop_codon:yes gene_type:complete
LLVAVVVEWIVLAVVVVQEVIEQALVFQYLMQL